MGYVYSKALFSKEKIMGPNLVKFIIFQEKLIGYVPIVKLYFPRKR